MLHVVHGTLGSRDRSAGPEAAPLHLQFRLGRITMDPHRIIYATIMLMTAYAIYDEGTDPLKAGPIIEIIGLSLAPLFALAMAHAFSDGLDLQIRNDRRLTRHDRRHLFGTNLQYLYVAIPPTIVITVARPARDGRERHHRFRAGARPDLAGLVGLLRGPEGQPGTRATRGCSRSTTHCMGHVDHPVELILTH